MQVDLLQVEYQSNIGLLHVPKCNESQGRAERWWLKRWLREGYQWECLKWYNIYHQDLTESV